MAGVAAGRGSFDRRVQIARADHVEPDVPHSLAIAMDASEHLVDDFVRRADGRSIGRPE